MLCSLAPTRGAGLSARTWNTAPAVSTLAPAHQWATKALARTGVSDRLGHRVQPLRSRANRASPMVQISVGDLDRITLAVTPQNTAGIEHDASALNAGAAVRFLLATADACLPSTTARLQ